MTKLLACWLLPKESIRAVFGRLIEDLARQESGPVFAPHVTIRAETVEEEPDPAAIRAVLEQMVAGFSPITLHIARIGTSDDFTKTLFVEFAEHEELSALSERLQEMNALRFPYELHPHLSLLYADLSAERKQMLAGEVRLRVTDCQFDRVAVITGAAPTKSREDVQSWRIIAEAALH